MRKLMIQIKKTVTLRIRRTSSVSAWKKRASSSPSLPWLVPQGEQFYVSYDRERELLGYSPSDDKSYRLHLFGKKDDGTQYIGSSSHGWMILLNNITRKRRGQRWKSKRVSSEQEELDVSLKNPISRCRVQLPRVTQGIHYWEYPKLAMSSPPDKPDCFVTVVAESRRILLCRVGDRNWTTLSNCHTLPPNPMIDSAVYCAGKFYYKLQSQPNLIIVDPTLITMQYLEMDANQLPSEWNQSDTYILESNSEVLLVVDLWNYDDGLRVFKADVGNKAWVETKRFSDDRVLFLSSSDGFCFSVPAAEVGCSRGNFVYLSRWDRAIRRCSRQYLWVSFDMETGKVEKRPLDAGNKELMAEGKLSYGLHWFVPKL